jgi:hypothetical protein
MKKLILTIFCIVAVNIFCFSELNNRIPINFSYFGEQIIHPGIQIGYEYNLPYHFIADGSLGYYVHERNHVGLFLNAGIGWRYTFKIGYSLEFGLGLGYLHTWEHGGDIYIVSDTGNVSIKPKYGHPKFMPTVKIGLLGWDFRKKTNVPLRLNIDAIVFGEYPFNSFMMPHFALKAGATYFFKFPEGKK